MIILRFRASSEILKDASSITEVTKMSEDLVEFLEDGDGVVEILATIEVGGTRFKKLKDLVGVSHDTVAKRLGEAEDHGLVKREAVAGERGTVHKWALTAKGARLRRILESTGAVKHYNLLQMYRQRLEENKSRFFEEVGRLEEQGELDDETQNELALHSWKNEVSEE